MKLAMRVLFAGAALAALSGCATSPEALVAARDKQLTDRAEARWESLTKGQLDAAYGFLSPGSKAKFTAEAYKGTIKPGLWRGAKVQKISCASDDVCKVTMLVSYAFRPKGSEVLENQRPIDETWRKDANDWWFVYEP